MYGPGDSDVVVMSMAVDSTERVLIGGQSKFIQTTTGEGFVMLVNSAGAAQFVKTYATGASNGDIVNKVVMEETSSTYIAVGTSDTGTNAFFFLIFDSAGVILKNLLIATDATLVAATSRINQLYLQGTDAHVVFDTSVGTIIDTAGAAADRYVGVVGHTGNIIRIVQHSPFVTAYQYSFFAIRNGFIATYYFNSGNPAAGNNDIATDIQSKYVTTAALQTSDVNIIAAPGAIWVGVYPTTGSRFIAFHYTIGGGAALPAITVQFQVTTTSVPISLTISYVSTTAFYTAAMLTNGEGVVYYNAGAAGTFKVMTTSLSGAWFVGSKTSLGTVYVTAGTKIGGESAALTNSQAIVFKSDLQATSLDVTPYNCYNILPYSVKADVAYGLAANGNDATFRTHIDGTSAQTTNTVGTLADSTAFVLRSESTMTAADGSFCGLNPPIFNFNASITYSTEVDDYATIKSMITHCRGDTMTYVLTVGGVTVPWATGASDTLGIIPSLVTPTHCCNTANILTVTAYTDNLITNTATDTINIIFTDHSPVVVVAVPDQVFYKGQGATAITASSITDSTTLAFTLATAVSAADYTTLTIDATTGNPITIGMASNYTGTATMTITATDAQGFTATDVFDVLVLECPQDNCDTCTSGTDGDCIGCDEGYILTSGECFLPVVPPVIPEPIYYSSYLNTGVGDAA
jgi:hypothetical protein